MASVKSVAITNLDAVPAVNSDGGNLSPMMVWHDRKFNIETKY